MGTCLGRALAAAVVVVTAACGSYVAGAAVPAASDPATTRPAAATGVAFGIVQAGPTCPVASVGQACRPRPLGEVGLRARSARTGLTVSTRTSTGGRFFVRLRPGEYVLTVATTEVSPGARWWGFPSGQGRPSASISLAIPASACRPGQPVGPGNEGASPVPPLRLPATSVPQHHCHPHRMGGDQGGSGGPVQPPAGCRGEQRKTGTPRCEGAPGRQ